MALALQPTLAALTAELLTLIGQGGTGVANAALNARAEASIRRAQLLVNQEADWTINRKRASVALAANATTFDWPDDVNPGDIIRVSAVRNSNLKYEWDLTGGIDSDDRTSWAYGGFSTVQDVPYKFDFHDGTIEVGPAASGAVTIYLYYTVAPSPMTVPDDRPNCDGEAVLRKAEIVLRNQLGPEYQSAVPGCTIDYNRYLDLVKHKQGATAGFQPGGTWGSMDMARRTWRQNQSRHWAFRTRRP